MRWYSPRDYVEEEVVDEKGNTTVTGTLSPRMKIPGNMWVEAWETARVTPARRQKRLFDDTKEAEKVRSRSFCHMRVLSQTCLLSGSQSVFMNVSADFQDQLVPWDRFGSCLLEKPV